MDKGKAEKLIEKHQQNTGTLKKGPEGGKII